MIHENGKTASKWKLVFIAFSLVLFIVIEIFYRKPLFNISLKLIKKLQAYNNVSLHDFFKVVTFFGDRYILISLIIIAFNWCTLCKSYVFLKLVVISVYFDNLLKIIYNNPRPFWVDLQIEPIACDGGYGNPSGHSFSSPAVYLAFWHLTTDNKFFKKRKWLSLIYFFLTTLLVFSILLSRLYLGVHALNQIIYGFTLSLTLYSFYFIGLRQHKLGWKLFFERFCITSKIILYWIIWAVLALIMIFLYIFFKTDQTYRSIIKQRCPSLQKTQFLQDDAFYNSLVIYGIMGADLGLTILYFITTRNNNEVDVVLEHLNKWTQTKWYISILRLIVLLALFIIPPLLPFILIPLYLSLPIIYIFKVSIPFFLTWVLLFSAGILFCKYIGFAKNYKGFEVVPNRIKAFD